MNDGPVGQEVVAETTDRVRWLTLSRPGSLNALNAPVLDALSGHLDRVEAGEEGIRVVVLQGAGDRAFSAGADLKELEHRSEEEALALLRKGQALFRRIEQSPVPIVAAVDGAALGGGFELALACTFLVASERASFGLPEAELGLMPGYGGTQRLTRLVGPAVARSLCILATRLNAQQADKLGLLALPPVPLPAFPQAVVDLAATLAEREPSAVRAILASVRNAVELDVDAGLARESELAARAIGTLPGSAAISAFVARRGRP